MDKLLAQFSWNLAEGCTLRPERIHQILQWIWITRWIQNFFHFCRMTRTPPTWLKRAAVVQQASQWMKRGDATGNKKQWIRKIKIFFLDVSLWSSSKAKWTCPNLCLVIEKGATWIYEFRHVFVTQTDLQFLIHPLNIHDTDNAEERVRDSNEPQLLRFWPIVQPHILCTVIGWVLQVHYWKVDTKKRLQHSKIRKRNYRQMQVPC